jgi:hypothetical protein
MNKQTKAFIYNTLAFAVIFISLRFILVTYSGFSYFQNLIAAGLVSMIAAPKFHYVRTHEGEKIWMKWLFGNPKEVK